MGSIRVGNDAVRLELGMSGTAPLEAAAGSAGAVRVDDAASPSPGRAAVLVRVQAGGTAAPRTRRWAQVDLPPLIGYEPPGDGVATATRRSPPWFTPEIFGDRHGRYAEYLVTKAHAATGAAPGAPLKDVVVSRLPSGTAAEALLRRLDVRPGDSVLLHAGSGAVGPFAVQLTRARTPRGRLVTVLWSRSGRSAWTTVWRGNRAVRRRR